MRTSIHCGLMVKPAERDLCCCSIHDRPHWEGAKRAEAKWTRGEGNSVTFSGPIEFPIGNVGRDAGTLVLKGTFETEDLITGEMEFSSLGGDRPSKHGTFKAVRGK